MVLQKATEERTEKGGDKTVNSSGKPKLFTVQTRRYQSFSVYISMKQYKAV